MARSFVIEQKGSEDLSQQKEAADKVLRTLLSHGFEGYFVGGFVRDYLLEKPAKDIDVATNALPHQVESLFEQTIPTGIQHGTITVLINRVPIEVTTYRIDGEYLDSRRPSEVHYVSSLKQDLSRRDFTINAMAMDLQGTIHDPFNGQNDLQKRQIRAVGNPKERFTEDPLRMLRAIRFASQFQFEIEADTEGALIAEKARCQTLSQERITTEWEKIWQTDHSMLGVQYGFLYKLFEVLPPFANWRWKNEEALLPLFDYTSDQILQWSLLLYLAGTNQQNIVERAKSLRLSRKDVQQMELVFTALAKMKPKMSVRNWKLLLLKFGLKTIQRAIYLYDASKGIAEIERFQGYVHLFWTEMPVKQLSDLNINVPSLIAVVARPAGPWVRDVLERLLYGVALGEITNQREILIKEGYRFGTGDTQ